MAFKLFEQPTCESIYSSARVRFVRITCPSIVDVQIAIRQDDVLAANVRVGVQMNARVLHPGRHYHVILDVAWHLQESEC